MVRIAFEGIVTSSHSHVSFRMALAGFSLSSSFSYILSFDIRLLRCTSALMKPVMILWKGYLLVKI